jgi:NAD-dependent dihydropyrimidine dehydrogenase PreA subunit
MALLAEFVAAFGVWDVAQPYIHKMANEQEMRLIVGMQGRAFTAQQVADLMGMALDGASDFLQRCYSRCILNKTVENGVTRYESAGFAARLNHFAMYESWDEIPAEDRRAIDRCFLDHFIDEKRSTVDRKTQGLPDESVLPNDTVMLLGEVEEMIEAATTIVVQPCDCRRLGQNCDRPVETCIWLDESALDALDRGHGRPLTKEEAKDLLRWADKKGLMHTADSEWRTRGLHAICNCCACDCYPFRAGQELGARGVWPRSRHIAVQDRERCNLCGACVKRCHFGAFYYEVLVLEAVQSPECTGRVERQAKKNVKFDPDRCWGCGLCANTCPSGAILMQRLGLDAQEEEQG